MLREQRGRVARVRRRGPVPQAERGSGVRRAAVPVLRVGERERRGAARRGARVRAVPAVPPHVARPAPGVPARRLVRAPALAAVEPRARGVLRAVREVQVLAERPRAVVGR